MGRAIYLVSPVWPDILFSFRYWVAAMVLVALTSTFRLQLHHRTARPNAIRR